MPFQMFPPPLLQWEPSYAGPSATTPAPSHAPVPPSTSGSVSAAASGSGSYVPPAPAPAAFLTPAQLRAEYAALPPFPAPVSIKISKEFLY